MLLTGKGRGIVASMHGFVLPDRRTVTSALLFLAGCAGGALSAVRLAARGDSVLQSAVRIYLQAGGETALRARFLQLLLPDLTLMGIVFFCGFCAVAAPILLFLPFFKGLGFGMIVSFLYQQSGISSMKGIALTILPIALWSASLLILACRDAGLLSSGFREASRRGGTVSTDRFCAMMLLYLLLLCAGCALQAWSIVAFGGRLLPQL